MSERSAMSPAHAPISRTGPNWAAARKPIATPLSVSFRTSSVNATIVSQLPICEISWPLKKRRKLRTCSDWNVSLTPRRSLSLHRGSVVSASRVSSASARRARSSSPRSVQAGREPLGLPAPGRAEQVATLRRDDDPRDAPVGRIGLAGQEAVRLELGHDARDAWRRHLLVVGEGAEGQRPVTLDRGQRRELARREAGLGLLAEPAGETGRTEPEPARDGLGGLGAGAGGGGDGHDHQDTTVFSSTN